MAYVVGDEVVYTTVRSLVRPWREVEADRLFDILRREEVVQWFGDDAKALTAPSEAVERIRRRAQWEAGAGAAVR